MPNSLTRSQQELLADIVGTSELAALTGRSKQLVNIWTRDTYFPAPVLELKAGRFFRRSEVLEWVRVHRPDVEL